MYFIIVYVCLHDMNVCIGGHILYVGFLNKACILYLNKINVYAYISGECVGIRLDNFNILLKVLSHQHDAMT